MKIKRWVTCDHQVEINIAPEDIEVIFMSMFDNVLKTWLIQLNNVVIFLKGTPDATIKQLNSNQLGIITEALRDLANRFEQEGGINDRTRTKKGG